MNLECFLRTIDAGNLTALITASKEDSVLRTRDGQTPHIIKAFSPKIVKADISCYKLKEIPPRGDVSRLSKSENRDVRRYLCLSLRLSQNPEFIPFLTGLLKDVDFNVRFAASEAIKAIIAKNSRPDHHHKKEPGLEF